jgi:hypothetical protein
MGRGPLSLAILTFAFCIPTLAAAAEKPGLLLLPYQPLNKGVAPELAEQTTVVVAQEIGAMGIEVTRADDVAEAEAPGRAQPKEAGKNAPTGDPLAADRAKDLISKAKQTMEDSDLPPAIAHLKKAVKLLGDNGDAVPDLRLLAEGYLQLGVAHFRDSDEDAADEALTQAVHYAPTRELEETEYPPIFIRVFQRVRYNVLRRPRATVEVKAAPGAQVLLDGRNLGKAPMIMTEVLPGNHWIRVESPGEAPQVKKILVRSKRTMQVEFDGATAEPAAPQGDSVGVLGAIARNQLDKSHLEQLRAAGKRAGASYVMIGAIYKTETAYNIYTGLIAVSDPSAGRASEIAFDLDMLSAQIEVFKLAEDVKHQVKASKLTTPVNDPVFALAPKLDLHAPKKKAVAQAKETKVETVIAAPPPIPEPKDMVAGAGGEPLAAAAAAPVAAAAAGSVVRSAASVMPKDEVAVASSPSAASSGSRAGTASMVAPTTSVVPIDEAGDDEASPWWLWVLIGVAVAGGAGAGGYLLLSGGSPSEGTLRIHW